MTLAEFYDQDPPYFLRTATTLPPDDWPVKGVRGYDVNEQRLDYVRNYPNGDAAVARKLAAIRAKQSRKKAKTNELSEAG